jgi:hypothetical protein
MIGAMRREAKPEAKFKAAGTIWRHRSGRRGAEPLPIRISRRVAIGRPIGGQLRPWPELASPYGPSTHGPGCGGSFRPDYFKRPIF